VCPWVGRGILFVVIVFVAAPKPEICCGHFILDNKFVCSYDTRDAVGI